jgi:EAL domain-containing protein (putative c-di-GMP-specific phosphodiesterase class I)
MFNEFRSWLRPLENREGPDRQDVSFVETGPAACFVLDQEAASSQTLSATLQMSGLETELFLDCEGFIEGLTRRTPNMVFLDVTEEANAAIDAVFALGEHAYRGPVQLMGGRSVQVVETVKRMGERHSLTMLPVLQKPLEAAAIRQILQEQNLTNPATAPAQITLGEALKNQWIEFWYQPKIDLKKKQIAGVETFARLRHPQLGTLPPGVFMSGADEQSVTALTERALVSALTAATNFAQLGINLRVAVNISTSALVSLSLPEMVRQYGPKKANWPGLILDVTEEQINLDFARVRGAVERLASSNIKLAIDDFGGGYLSVAKLRELSFAELKLARACVTNCGTDRTNAAVCKTVVDLAHSLGSIAVGIGVEKGADVFALQAMGCDLGQGYLFGQPMPEEELVAMLRQRSTAAKAPTQPQVARARAR